MHYFTCIRILRLREAEAGLIAEWDKWYTPSASKCMKINQRNYMPRLSLKHLSSPFVIFIGYILELYFMYTMTSKVYSTKWNRPTHF